MKMNKRQWIGLWHAKGWKLEAVEAAVGRRGFSRTSLSDMGQSTEPADPELVALAWKADVLGQEEDFEIYWRGLASIGVEVPPELLAKLENPPPPRVDPQEIAAELTPKLDTLLSSMGARLDGVISALTGKLDNIAASLRGKLDTFSLAVEANFNDASAKFERTHEKLDSAHGKLDVVQATLNDTDAKIDIIDAKLDGNRRELRRLLAFGALVMLAAVSSCVVAVSQRLTAPAPAPVHELTVNIGLAGIEEAICQRDRFSPIEAHALGGVVSNSSNSIQMGEKVPPSRWIPKQPFPWQKLAKDCDPAWGEAAINGGCWVPIAGVAPPCGELFRHGDICYRPVAADPQKPVGVTP